MAELTRMTWQEVRAAADGTIGGGPGGSPERPGAIAVPTVGTPVQTDAVAPPSDGSPEQAGAVVPPPAGSPVRAGAAALPTAGSPEQAGAAALPTIGSPVQASPATPPPGGSPEHAGAAALPTIGSPEQARPTAPPRAAPPPGGGPEQQAHPPAGAIALLTIGSQEQHAAHLPMGTDTMLAEAVVDGALARLGGEPAVVRLPSLPFGHSPHHLFAAAVSLSAATLAAVLADVLDSLVVSGFRRVLVVNGHGGNDEIMRLAVKQYALRADVALAACSYWSLGESGSPGHAGVFETSLMLAARPELVRERAPRPDVTPPPLFDRPPYPGLTVERHGEWARAGGSTDDATAATAERGRDLLAARATALAEAVRAFDAATRESHGHRPQGEL